jgi:hypothetical protein
MLQHMHAQEWVQPLMIAFTNAMPQPSPCQPASHAQEWANLKPKMPYGHVPVLEVGGILSDTNHHHHHHHHYTA